MIAQSMKVASRLMLLQELQQMGAPIRENPNLANHGRIKLEDPEIQFEVSQVDVARVFALRVDGVKGRSGEGIPWGTPKEEQEEWGGGLLSMHESLQALIDYYRRVGHLPDQDRDWELRCSDPYGVCSMCITYKPREGGIYLCMSGNGTYGPGFGAFPKDQSRV